MKHASSSKASQITGTSGSWILNFLWKTGVHNSLILKFSKNQNQQFFINSKNYPTLVKNHHFCSPGWLYSFLLGISWELVAFFDGCLVLTDKLNFRSLLSFWEKLHIWMTRFVEVHLGNSFKTIQGGNLNNLISHKLFLQLLQHLSIRLQLKRTHWNNLKLPF
jgi:hypothetical protein